jgi:hypothetical protein
MTKPIIPQAAVDAASKFIPKHDHFYDSQVEKYWDDLEKAIEVAAPHIIAANTPASGWNPLSRWVNNEGCYILFFSDESTRIVNHLVGKFGIDIDDYHEVSKEDNHKRMVTHFIQFPQLPKEAY